ncbi:MAG: glycoside hydrolase family 2 TIM barrel-domain containing protein [Prevotella sp.]|nr:glycoside hydrolase family 2 TIM barrel-domain containing protein [Prevotella sp.]
MKKQIMISLTLATALTAWAQERQEKWLNEGWQFSRDKVTWQDVRVPHDWAISGPFDKKWDLQTVAIEQNGEKEKTEKSGRSGALPWIGKGHYKRSIYIDQSCSRAELLFDGAMSEPTVYVNGQLAGKWAYGYNAFRVDITPMMRKGENKVEVELNNVEESSRWYPGGGIYRPVKLITTGKVYIDDWSIFAHTTKLEKKMATVEVTAKVMGQLTSKNAGIEIALYDKKGGFVAANRVVPTANGEVKASLDVEKPQLWSPESPYLYQLVTRVYQDNQLIDEVTMPYGVRTVKVSKENGFQLNGVTRKIKGVCLHHDLGPLGVAENRAALIRQITTMKAMGCDAIRTAHNMPSTMMMNLCDSLGMMVMAESFDMWVYPKCKNGYARFYKEWSDRDITNLILNHRNHPAIVMWSIGNEIPEQGMKGGQEMAKHLQDLCHKLDPSRPVTQGMDRVDNALKTGFAQTMDVPGFNYRLHRYEPCIDKLPQGFLLGSETASTVSSRGVYKFPVVVSDHATYPDGQCSSYDTEYCSWSNLPDDDWRMQDDKSWVIGEFVWTGYDYLGEPTPYDTYWPSRSSYFGICDLAGLPKDRYFLYRSKWNAKEHTTHLLPHWTWPGREGEVTPVYCYTDGVEGELFVNGKSQGRIKKDASQRLDRYRLRWNNVRYEAGELKVVTYDKEGKKIGETVRKTAGTPASLEANVWTEHKNGVLKPNGNDLAFITVWLNDKNGTMVPTADDNLTFEVSGAGKFVAACNGDATSLQPFTQPEMKLFSGQLVLVVSSKKMAGDIKVKISDKQRKLVKELTLRCN